jgi:hypothetical protein
MAARIIRFEDAGDFVIAHADDGQTFRSPRGVFDWKPVEQIEANTKLRDGAIPKSRKAAGLSLARRLKGS